MTGLELSREHRDKLDWLRDQYATERGLTYPLSRVEVVRLLIESEYDRKNSVT